MSRRFRVFLLIGLFTSYTALRRFPWFYIFRYWLEKLSTPRGKTPILAYPNGKPDEAVPDASGTIGDGMHGIESPESSSQEGRKSFSSFLTPPFLATRQGERVGRSEGDEQALTESAWKIEKLAADGLARKPRARIVPVHTYFTALSNIHSAWFAYFLITNRVL